MTLPMHILDAYRIHCPRRTVEEWVETFQDCEEVRCVAKKIQSKLCSPPRVSHLRHEPLPKRDVPLENIILFLYYALILREFSHAIKRGDVGSVINILAHWMVIFRGTGKMPKYADALFHLRVLLKQMSPAKR
jgi:hypothetical protein